MRWLSLPPAGQCQHLLQGLGRRVHLPLGTGGCSPSPSSYLGLRPTPAGRRLCLGESLARMELFLFLTAILQNFSLQPLGDPEDIDLTPISSGLGNVPRPFQLCVRAR